MIYPFLTLNDGTEIVHSEMRPDQTVKVYIEKPDAEDCFHSATCILPLRFAQEGGLENAASF